MKKIFIIILSIILCGCGNNSSKVSPFERWMQEEGKIKILSTTRMIDDLVENIGKEKVAHLALIVGEIDPHTYELVKGDDEKLNRADIIFYNGLGLEHGASLRYRLQNDPKAKSLGDLLYNKEPDQFLVIDAQIDPHIWMDVSLWAKTIEIITEELIKFDPKEEMFFRKNADVLKDKMVQLHQKIYTLLQKIPPESRYLVTSHDAFNYFARGYLLEGQETDWKKRFIAPEGLAPDGQLSVTDIHRIVDHLISHEIGTIFPESNVSRDSLKKIASVCAQKGLKVNIANVELYADAMGGKGTSADTYFKMMEHDALAIGECLEGVR